MKKLFLLLGLLIPGTGFAQSYSIDWYKIAGGGGSYSLTGGFWSLYAVQTLGAPALTITHSGNSVKVLWPYPSTGWTLRQNSDLTTANWTASGGISNDGTINFITITSPTGNMFFRLKQP